MCFQELPMSASATVRVMSPEEIAARAGGETPYFQWPSPASVFAERAMRLRQLARGHAMAGYLEFIADLALAQQHALAAFPSVPLPDSVALDAAARRGAPPLPAADWPRDPAWHAVLRGVVAELRAVAPAGAQDALQRLADADADFLERQADCLLVGVMAGLDLACAPLVAAALQVYWLQMVAQVREQHSGGGQPFGRTDDETACPCCGSRPTASITRSAGESLGQRYLHCSLCGTQWHMVRIKCSQCLSTKGLAYHSLDAADAPEANPDDGAPNNRAAHASIQAETCDDCGQYLKIMHSDRDPFVEPVADDLATLTLDLLISDTGKLRHGVNLMLLLGDPDAAPETPSAPAPRGGAQPAWDGPAPPAAPPGPGAT
jgi:FdhE protein